MSRAAILAEGRVWAILEESLGALFVGEVTGKSRAAASRASSSSSSARGIAVIPLYGVLTARGGFGGTSLEWFASALRLADASSQFGAIVLDIDSPGGSTSLVTETAAMIRAASTPTTAVVNTLAASAAYWLASQADEVVASPSSMLGSIGIYVVHEDISGLLQKAGVKTTLISAGKHKLAGHPTMPLSDAGREGIKSLVDDAYGAFTRDVALGRAVPVDDVRSGFGEGRLVTAARAVEAGMADRVGTLDQTIARLERGQLPESRVRKAISDRKATGSAERVRAHLAALEATL